MLVGMGLGLEVEDQSQPGGAEGREGATGKVQKVCSGPRSQCSEARREARRPSL